jgi:hypothetical protein
VEEGQGPCELCWLLAQGLAYVQLERYQDAESAFLEGLSVDPSNQQLRAELQKLVQSGHAGLREGGEAAGTSSEVLPLLQVAWKLAICAAGCTRAAFLTWIPVSIVPPASARACCVEEQVAAKRARRCERVDECDCVLCLKLLYEPVTTPCGECLASPTEL